MITFLRGLVAEKHPTRVVLDVGGVGYEVFIPLSSYDRLPLIDESCKILVYDHIREDTHQLFGFMSEQERVLFSQLIAINGIGPKLALSALSGMTVRDLRAAVLEGDVKRLSSIQGVGKKMAERLVVELRDKISNAEALEASAGNAELGQGEHGSLLGDSVAALMALGYSSDQARKMVERALKSRSAPKTVADMIKQALSGR